MSWLNCNPSTQIILFTKPTEFDKFNYLSDFLKPYINKRLFFYSDIEFGYDNRPLIRDWIIKGRFLCRTEYLCYLNFDIIVSKRWFLTCKNILLGSNFYQNQNTVIVNARINFNIPPEYLINFTYISKVSANVEYFFQKFKINKYENGGIDLFIISKDFNAFDFNKLPDFVIGLCAWDNVVTGYFNYFANSISLLFNPPIYHINHGPNKCNETNIKLMLDMYNAHKLKKIDNLFTHMQAKWFFNYSSNELVKQTRDKTVVKIAG